MVKKQLPLKEEVSVETRGLVDSLEGVKEKLRSLSAVRKEAEKITDEHYADLAGATPSQHTYERIGKAARVRQTTTKGKTRIGVVIKEGLAKTTEGVFSHDAVRSKIIFSGEASKIGRARELVKEQGFPELILVIKKTREVYTLEEMAIYLELIEGFGPAIEIRTVVEDESQLAGIKETQLGFLNELGIEEKDILKTSHTHMLISARITADPKIKVPYLREELKKLERKLEEKMKGSNLEYCEAGDAWHDNLAWDSLMNETRLLRARIREVKEELSRTEA